jgi:hypothetical protein
MAVTISVVAGANQEEPQNSDPSRSASPANHEPVVITGTATDCEGGAVITIHSMEVRALDPSTHKELVRLLRSMDTLTWVGDGVATQARFEPMYSRMVYLYRSSTPLARDTTTRAGTFTLTVPSSDSVLVIAHADSEEEPVYAYRMVNARTNVKFELDMSRGYCGALLIAPEDSILNEGSSDRWVALPNGDSVKGLGGSMMAAASSALQAYRSDYYTKNSTQYLRIQRLVGHTPKGNPIWVMRARLRLPPMDSTDVVTEGVCRINGKSDPSILAITATVGDSVHFHARHAWRFDRATETLRELPAAGVTCAHPHGDPNRRDHKIQN